MVRHPRRDSLPTVAVGSWGRERESAKGRRARKGRGEAWGSAARTAGRSGARVAVVVEEEAGAVQVGACGRDLAVAQLPQAHAGSEGGEGAAAWRGGDPVP